MISLLGDLVRNLIILIFVATVLELLMPQGQFQSYLRMVAGLIVILMVVNFITGLTGKLPGEMAAVQLPAGGGATAGLQADLWQFNRRQALAAYRSSLEDFFRQTVEQEGWQLVSLSLSIEEDPGSDSFGAFYAAGLIVADTAARNNGYIEPILIEPVQIEPRQDAAAYQTEAVLNRVPALESILAARLQLPAGLIKVYKKESS